jgi:3-phenylpropionate/trans-cinnamate dioxygenase ferredoxin subunit
MSAAVRIAPLAELPDGRGVRVDVAGRRVALFRIGSTVRAIADRCSHAEASLAEGEVVDGTVECPRHGAGFDLETGDPTCLPATEPVSVFPAEIVDGDVYLILGPEAGVS